MDRGPTGGAVLVASATGRVGSSAVGHLLRANFRVRALVRSPDKGEPLSSSVVAVGDVTEPETLAPAVEGCSAVYSALAEGTGTRRRSSTGATSTYSWPRRRPTAALCLQFRPARGSPAR